MSGGTKWKRAKDLDAQAQRLFAASKPKDAVPSREIVNAAIRETYKTPPSFYRNDGHKQVKSFGTLC